MASKSNKTRVTVKPEDRKSIVPLSYQKAYGKGANCGDPLAKALEKALKPDGKKVDPDVLISVGHENGIDVPARWGGLNVGQQRMNLGNVLRNRVKKGEPVLVLGKKVA